jgi:hypothetical protein
LARRSPSGLAAYGDGSGSGSGLLLREAAILVESSRRIDAVEFEEPLIVEIETSVDDDTAGGTAR